VTYYDAAEFAARSVAARILVADDDPAMQRVLVSYLVEHNLQATGVSGRKGLMHALAVREPDVVILDASLGGSDGFGVLRDLRNRSLVPVILMSALCREEVDRVLGLELGADDYLTKPFGLRELLARIRATLRRRTMDRIAPSRQSERRYRFSGWSFNQRSRELFAPDGTLVPLTKSEFALLSALVEAPRRTLSREYLLQATRVHEDVYDRSIDVQILRLRRKLEEDPGAPRLIRTERGVGYRFDTDVDLT
jgi:two-component system, OmpR family, response regulator